MIHIYCGDGKGKSTAAMGLCLRMAGSGGKVLLGQFFKDGTSSEISALRQLPEVTVRHCATVPGRYRNMTDSQRQQVRRDYTAYLEALLAEAVGMDLLVLDEAISACNHGIIPEETLLRFLDLHQQDMEIVLTGRAPSEPLLTRADYVTEMRKQKHPFDQGILARRGVEY